MLIDAGIDNTTDARWRRSDLEREYGVQVNAVSVSELFALYERTGFLYPAKAARLRPHLARVRDNWNRLLRAEDALLYVLTAGDTRDGRASIAVWRTNRTGWTWQHLVCEGNPLASRAAMLGGLTRCMRRGVEESQQNWYRPENRFPSRVFGSMVQSVGDALSSAQRHVYFAWPRQATRHSDRHVQVVPYDPSQHEALCALAARARGGVYVNAEELESDVELAAVNCLYQRVGLRRSRHVWLAYSPGGDEPVGAALAYRGPLGLNFSFIENRCDLLLDPNVSEADAAAATGALMDAALEAYADFELDDIPVMADLAASPQLCALGGRFLRHYCHGIWLEDAQPSMYRHVDRFYARLLERTSKRGVKPTFTV